MKKTTVDTMSIPGDTEGAMNTTTGKEAAMTARVGKTMNVYQKALDSRLYTDCPKAVFAAIAVSSLTQGGDFLEEATARLAEEWWILYENGIVPQKPPGPKPADPE